MLLFKLKKKTNDPPSKYKQNICALIFIAALCTVVKRWKQRKCPSTNE